MKRMIALATASVIGLAAPALAQSDGGSIRPPPDTGLTPDVVVPDPHVTSSTNSVDAAKAALDAINGSRNASTELGALTAVSRINVVKISEVGGDPTEFQSAIDANKDHATGVQAAIKASPALSAELDTENVDLSSVVAAHIEADGSVTVYVQ